MNKTYIKTLADTIEWLAIEVQEGDHPCQDFNAAIHSICMEVDTILCGKMAGYKGADKISAGCAWR